MRPAPQYQARRVQPGILHITVTYANGGVTRYACAIQLYASAWSRAKRKGRGIGSVLGYLRARAKDKRQAVARTIIQARKPYGERMNQELSETPDSKGQIMRISHHLFKLARVLQTRHYKDLLWDSRVLRRAEAGTRFLWMSYPSGSHMMELCPRDEKNRCSRLLRSWWSCFGHHPHMLYEIEVRWMDGRKAMGDVRPVNWDLAVRMADYAQIRPAWKVLVAA